MQWPKEKVQKDKQRSTKHKTNDRVTQLPSTRSLTTSCMSLYSLLITFTNFNVILKQFVYWLVWIKPNYHLDRYLEVTLRNRDKQTSITLETKMAAT
jgi:hypothetical protein